MNGAEQANMRQHARMVEESLFSIIRLLKELIELTKPTPLASEPANDAEQVTLNG